MKVLLSKLRPVFNVEAEQKRHPFAKSYINLQVSVFFAVFIFTSTVIAQTSTPCFQDNTSADFKSGDPGSFTYLSNTDDGEVLLKPIAGAEFSEMPSTSEWRSFPFTSTGTSAISNGSLAVGGSRFNSESSDKTFGPGTSLEFVATFGYSTFQHIGFAGGTDDVNPGGMFYQAPWAMFSTGNTANTLFARTFVPGSGGSHDVAITNVPNIIGSSHRFRIDWKADGSFNYFVDDMTTPVLTEPGAITDGMRTGISDFNNSAGSVLVDWIRVLQFPDNGTFESRINDAGSAKVWGKISWTTSEPSGTNVAIFVRKGNSSSVDDSWTSYDPIASSGDVIGGTAARYIQYKAVLTTSDPGMTPVLKNISVNCNTAPVLATINYPTEVAVGTPVSFTASAADAENQTLTYSLTGAPDGASIDPNSGAFSWTPAATNSYQFKVRVTDNGSPALYDEQQISITVPNHAPVLASINDKTLTLGETLSFTATASDVDAGQKLAFSLVNNPPDGAVIDAATGDFSWKPTSTGSFNTTVKVTDDGTPKLSDQETITVTVNSVPVANQPPILESISNKTISTGQNLTFTAHATDADGDQITYSLVSAPSGAIIGGSTGVFNWTPQSAGSVTFSVIATDNGSPSKSDQVQVSVTVNPANRAPVLAAIGSRTISLGQILTFTATAADPDQGQTKTFTLINAPAGATINQSTGAFSWKPGSAGIYSMKVRVTDNGTPPLYDEETIFVTVKNTSSTFTLAPVADAYIRNGSYANTNYGKATSLVVKGTALYSNSRSSYLKFSLSSITSNVTSAKLRIYGRNSENTTTVYIKAYGVNSDSWSESTITWNNAPTPSAGLNSAGVNSQARYYDIDVTGFVQAQLGGDKVVSFLVKDPSNRNITLSFNSRENSTNQPQLIVSTTAVRNLSAIADAYVRNGASAGINYGKDQSLIVKGTSSVGYARSSFLKFTLSSISIVKSAKLRIYGRNTESTANIYTSVFGVTNDSWTETGITWNNAPTALTSVLSSVNVDNEAKYYELDVTGYVRAQLAGDKTVSFLIKNPQNQNRSLSFNSRENWQYQPQLVIDASTSVTSTTNAAITNAEARTDDNGSLVQPKNDFRPTKVYPNPAGKIFNVELSKKYTGKVSLQIIDAAGKVYPVNKSSMKTSSVTQVDISDLNLLPGMYFLRILSQDGKSEIIKLVIQG